MNINIYYKNEEHIGVLGTSIGFNDENGKVLCVGDIVKVCSRIQVPIDYKYPVIVAFEDGLPFLFGLQTRTKGKFKEFIEEYSIIIVKSHKAINNDDKDYISYKLSLKSDKKVNKRKSRQIVDKDDALHKIQMAKEIAVKCTKELDNES